MSTMRTTSPETKPAEAPARHPVRHMAPVEVLDTLRSAEKILLTSHVNPDGDALGSTVALGRILDRLGKTTQVWLRDPFPAVYSRLVGSERVHLGQEPPPGFPTDWDLVVVLECPSLDRTGLDDALPALPLVNIDHHLGNEGYGAVAWVDTNAPAVGEMVHRLAEGLGVEIDPDTANALYLTLVTDTGGFRFSNTNALAFEAAAALVRRGARPEVISLWLYESQPEAALRLVGEMLRTLELHGDGRVATAWLDRGMIHRSGAGPGDSEGLIDYPRSIAGVDLVALFRELEEGGYKVSLRSRGAFDVERIARRHGGGGHKNAAGFSLDGSRAQVFETTVRSLLEVLK